MTVIERLRDKANSLPMTPGVYLMKNAEGNIIYVGKSKKLKNRVTSYFTGTGHSVKTARMVSLVRDFDYIVCKTEIEALSLENTLIKKHSPKYNIKLKDAKSYPYIKLSTGDYPSFTVTRQRHKDKGRYFGPYRGASDAYTALDTVKKIFSLPVCHRSFPEDIGKQRPCIYKDMGRCIAPCTGRVTPEEFAELVKGASGVLEGNTRATKNALEEQMLDAAVREQFELAARLRDSIRAIEMLSEKQKVVASPTLMRDVFALYTGDCAAVLAMLCIRGGALVHKNEFILSTEELTSPEDALSLIVDYYDGNGTPPKEVMLDFTLSSEDAELLSEYLSLSAPYRVHVRIPERGDGRAICDLALANAKESARQARLEGERENKSVKRLSELLGLAEIPKRIEAYDISNIGDEAIRASMVVYEQGRLKKSDYRIFSVREGQGRDDYASMREVVERRLSHLGDGTPSLGQMPELILLDGGVGHVNAVREVLDRMGLQIPLYGMVKDDFHKTRAITDGATEISIARELNVYGFVFELQEEAHRFALRSSSEAKRRTLTHSVLERIDGIGPAKAARLLAAMPLGKIKKASVSELAAIKGISMRDALAIRAFYDSKKKK